MKWNSASIKQQPALIAREMAHALGPSIQQQSMVVATEVASILATQQGRSNLVSNSDRPAEEGDVVHGQIVGASDCRSSNSGSQTSATRRRVKIPKLHSILHRLGIDLLEAEEQNSLSAPRTKCMRQRSSVGFSPG
jgi:ssRNA-specific RNase YbeY (16S rRNA maturation enzyme)